MVKKHYRLIDSITDLNNLRLAYQKTSRNKRMTWGYLEFKEYAEANLLQVRYELSSGTYKIGSYRNFTVYEPKPRLISALDFKDRLVQHAICNITGPIFDRMLMPQTFACRTGKGTHAGVRFVQSKLRSTKARYFLKTDFSKFFPSIDRRILHERIEQKIGCETTLGLLREIVPPQGKGLPIGSLTSQIFANVYGDMVDRHIHFDLGLKHWARYMDDVVVLSDDLQQLKDAYESISAFAAQRMDLRISKWQASPISQGINFLGYRIWPTHKLLRKDSVLRAKRKIDNFVRHGNTDDLQKFVASWSGHARWADTHNLTKWLEAKHGITF